MQVCALLCVSLCLTYKVSAFLEYFLFMSVSLSHCHIFLSPGRRETQWRKCENEDRRKTKRKMGNNESKMNAIEKKIGAKRCAGEVNNNLPCHIFLFYLFACLSVFLSSMTIFFCFVFLSFFCLIFKVCLVSVTFFIIFFQPV